MFTKYRLRLIDNSHQGLNLANWLRAESLRNWIDSAQDSNENDLSIAEVNLPQRVPSGTLGTYINRC